MLDLPAEFQRLNMVNDCYLEIVELQNKKSYTTRCPERVKIKTEFCKPVLVQASTHLLHITFFLSIVFTIKKKKSWKCFILYFINCSKLLNENHKNGKKKFIQNYLHFSASSKPYQDKWKCSTVTQLLHIIL